MNNNLEKIISRENSGACAFFVPSTKTRNDFLEEMKKDIHGVEIDVVNEESFSVESARSIVERSIIKPESGVKKIYILSFGNISIEAQNTMLKILEEPIENVLFVLLSGTRDLLPTVKSRLSFFDGYDDSSYDDWAKDFLKMSKKQRIDDIKKHLDEENADVSARLMAIIRNLDKNKHKDALPFIIKNISYSKIRGASQKMLLESVALSI